jgi:hypothetical protein
MSTLATQIMNTTTASTTMKLLVSLTPQG